MATFADIMATASSLLTGEYPEETSRESWTSNQSCNSSQYSATELDDLDHHGKTYRTSDSTKPSTSSSPAIRNAVLRSHERRLRNRGNRSDQDKSSISTSDRDSYLEDENEDDYYDNVQEDPSLLNLTACIDPSSYRSGTNKTKQTKQIRHTKQRKNRQPTVASISPSTASPASPSSPSSTTSTTSTTVTSRVMCSLRDTTKFVSLTRVGGNTNRVAAVERSDWTPKMRTETMQYTCLRTIGPLSQLPRVALVLARDHGGTIRHLSVYSVLGRPVGVEWAKGVPTWSNRYPGQHVLQEMDEDGIPSCPAVFEVTRWSHDPHKWMLSHRGCPLIIDGLHRITLGTRMSNDALVVVNSNDVDGMEQGTLYFNTPPIDLRMINGESNSETNTEIERREEEETKEETKRSTVDNDVKKVKKVTKVTKVTQVTQVRNTLIESQQEVVADGAVSWYLQGSVEYHFFQVALKSWIERTAKNSDENDPDRSWRWPVEYLSDAVVDLFPTLNTTAGRDATTRAAERVLFREFWTSLVTDIQPPHKMCSILSRNLVWARRQKELGGEIVSSFVTAGRELSQLRLHATPSWNVKVVGRAFELLASVKDIDEERSADFFLPAMVGAVTLSAIPAEILLLLREVLRSVYPLGRYGYWSTTLYAAVEYILQQRPEFVSEGNDELAYDSDNNGEVYDDI